jgi:hypothetical protein
MTLQVVDGPTIAAGQSLSDGIDCSAGEIVRITIPQEFTRANITFQVSSDGNFYNDLYNANGEEIMIAAQPNSAVIIAERLARVVAFIKLRSGTRKNPVLQQVDCKFAIAIETGAPAGVTAGAPQRR